MSTELSPRSISFKSVQVFAVIGAGAILQFAFYVLLARLLGIESYGIYAFGFSVYTLSLLIVKLSGDTLILRELSVHTDDSNAAGVVQFIVSIVTLLYVLLACLYALFGLAGLIEEIYLGVLAAFLVIMPLGVLMKFAISVARVRGFVLRSQVGDQLVRPLIAIVSLLVIDRFWAVDLWSAMLAFALGIGAGLMATVMPFFSIKRFVMLARQKHVLTGKFRGYLKSTATMTAISGQNVAIKQVDVIFLGLLSVPAIVGSYSAATKIAMLAVFMLSAVNMVIASSMARLFAEDRVERLQQMLTQASRLIAVFSFVYWLIVFMFADQILAVFGDDFSKAATVLRILVTAQLINAFFGPVGTLLNMVNKESVAVRILTVSFVVCLALNLMLIPVYGDIGAAIAYSVAILLWNASMAIYSQRQLGLNTTVFQR